MSSFNWRFQYLYWKGNLKNRLCKEQRIRVSLKNIPRKELLHKIDITIEIILKSFDKLDESILKNEYPILVFKEKTSTEYFLIHLTTHLSYHLGQINYHRRLFDN